MTADSVPPAEPELQCPDCGYDLTASPGDRCPSCGWFIDADQLAAAAKAAFAPRPWGFATASAIMAVGAIAAILILAGRSRLLTLSDGMAALGVTLAAIGHGALSILALRRRALRLEARRIVGRLIRFAALVSVLMGIFGATTVWRPGQKQRIVEGINVTGFLEFFMAAALFTIPGWLLLLLHRVYAERFTFSRPITASPATIPARSSPFQVDHMGRYSPSRVRCVSRETPRESNADLEQAIDTTWSMACARAESHGQQLFDAALVRLVSFRADPPDLILDLGQTSYRLLFGTHYHNVSLVRELGDDHLSNALGVSVLPVTSDGFLMLGRRSRGAVVHAGFVHLVGGLLESTDRRSDGSCDVFACAHRELQEEAGLSSHECHSTTLIALVRDCSLLQPELIFGTNAQISREALRSRVAGARDAREHSGVEFVYDDPDSIVPFIRDAEPITPVAQAALLIHGRIAWGTDWYEQACYLLYGELPIVRLTS